MGRFLLVLSVTVIVISTASAIKEWKNFENGKVYSHKTPSEKKDVQSNDARKTPPVEERLLHSHHRDKKMKASSVQSTESKAAKGKNQERHHRKSVEEEMGLRPLNERHHKFPNPALLEKTNNANKPNPQISTKDLVKQSKRGKVNNKRRQRNRKIRTKRNRGEQKGAILLNNNSNTEIGGQVAQPGFITEAPVIKKTDFNKQATPEVFENAQYTKDGYPLKISSYW